MSLPERSTPSEEWDYATQIIGDFIDQLPSQLCASKESLKAFGLAVVFLNDDVGWVTEEGRSSFGDAEDAAQRFQRACDSAIAVNGVATVMMVHTVALRAIEVRDIIGNGIKTREAFSKLSDEMRGR